jgi:beta-glucosidase
VTLESTLQLPSVLHRESTIRAWLEDPSRQGGLRADVPANDGRSLTRIFGGDDGDSSETIGMDTAGFMLDMPLLSILHFQEDSPDAARRRHC